MSYERLTPATGSEDGPEPDPQMHTVPRNLPAAVVAWLAMVPADVRPMRTAHRFPHVLRLLSQHWHAPEKLKATFEDLLYDNRGRRMGFPQEVLLEIESLRRIAKLPAPPPQKVRVVEPIAHQAIPGPVSEDADHNGYRSAQTMIQIARKAGLDERVPTPEKAALEFDVDLEVPELTGDAIRTTSDDEKAALASVAPHAPAPKGRSPQKA